MRPSHPPVEEMDGRHQAVVDQRQDAADEFATIQEADRRERRIARDEAAHEPTVQFWQTRTGNLGAILALLAGLFTLGIRIWPVAPPQSHGPFGTAWAIGVTITGIMYLLGFWLADNRQGLARTVLIVGALIHLGIGILAGTVVDAQQVAPGPLAMLFDIAPAVVALIAGFLIASRSTRREVMHETR